MTVSDDPIVVALERQRAAANALLALRDHNERRGALIREAVAAGLPRTEIAALLGVHRSTVYAELRKGARGDDPAHG